MKRNAVAAIALVVLAVAAARVEAQEDTDVKTLVKYKHGKKYCDQGWKCKGWSIYCCNLTIVDYFQTYQFENLFSKRNSPVAHAVGFWDYHSFIAAASLYEPLGFGTTGNKTMQMLEIAAFLGHVGSKTTCEFSAIHILWILFTDCVRVCLECEKLFRLSLLFGDYEICVCCGAWVDIVDDLDLLLCGLLWLLCC